MADPANYSGSDTGSLDETIAAQKQGLKMMETLGMRPPISSRDYGLITQPSPLDTASPLGAAFAQSAYKTPREVLETFMNKGPEGIDWKDPGVKALADNVAQMQVQNIMTTLGFKSPKLPGPGDN